MAKRRQSSAERLRIGQANIDRMKCEVEETVSTVLGVIGRDPLFFPYPDPMMSFIGDRRFESSEFVWTFTAWSPASVGVECWHLSDIGGNACRSLVYTNSGKSHFPRLDYVHLAHRARTVLVDGVLERLKMGEALAPLLDAADYQF